MSYKTNSQILTLTLINKNTMNAINSSQTTMSLTSSQAIYFSCRIPNQDYKSFKKVYLRFKQTSSHSSEVKVYNASYDAISKKYLIGMELFDSRIIETDDTYYREVDITNYYLSNLGSTIELMLVVTNGIVTIENDLTDLDNAPKIVSEEIEEDPFIENQKYLETQVSPFDKFLVNIRNGEIKGKVNLFSLCQGLLNLSLNYSTKDTLNSSYPSMPRGWKFNYQQKISYDSSTKKYCFIDEQDDKHYLKSNSNNTTGFYISEEKYYLTLDTTNSSDDNRYTLHIDETQKRMFDINGNLKKIRKYTGTNRGYDIDLTYNDDKIIKIELKRFNENESTIYESLNITYSNSSIHINSENTSLNCNLNLSNNNLISINLTNDKIIYFDYLKFQGIIQLRIPTLPTHYYLNRISYLNKEVEFDYLGQAKRVYKIKDKVDGEIENSYELRYENSQTRFFIYPKSNFIQNQGTLTYLYVFNDKGELYKEIEVKNSKYESTSIIEKDINRIKTYSNNQEAIFTSNKTFILNSTGNFEAFSSSSQKMYIFIDYELEDNREFIDNNASLELCVIDANYHNDLIKPIDLTKTGVGQLTFPFVKTNDQDSKVGLKFITNNSNIIFKINKIGVYKDLNQEVKLYSNISQNSNELVTLDNINYYPLNLVTIQYTFNGSVHILENVQMTNKDLLLTKISRIKNLIRNKSSHDVYFENGTKYLRNIFDFKINSMAFDNFKWMIGQGSLDYLSINKIEVINDNQNLLLKNISRVYAYLNDELNTYQETFYDAFNKKIKETNDHGLTKEYLYDSNDNLIKITIKNNQYSSFYGKNLSFNYAYLNNKLIQEESEGIGFNYAYDNKERLISIKNLNSSLNIFDNSYLDLLNLSQVNFPIENNQSETNNFTYDDNDNLSTIKQDGVLTYQYEYNNNKIQAVRINGDLYCSINHTYSLGLLTTTITYVNGETFTYSFDEYGRLLVIKKNGNIIRQYNYQNNENTKSSNAKLRSITNSLVNETFTYKLDGNLESNIKSFASPLQIQNYKLIYNQGVDYNQTDHYFQKQEATLQEYLDNEYKDVVKQVTKIKKDNNKATLVINETTLNTNVLIKEEALLEPLERGMNTKVTISNYQYKKNYSFLNGNNLSSLVRKESFQIGEGAIKDINISYDSKGNISSVSGDCMEVSYQYDHQNRLIRENNLKMDSTYIYEYDNRGNLISKKTYSYTTNQLPTDFKLNSYTYDDKNRLISINGSVVSYDSLNRPISYKGNSLTWEENKLMSYGSNNYLYGNDGLRIYKGNENTKRNYILDNGKIIKEIGNSESSSIIYIYGVKGVIGFRYKNNDYYYRKNIFDDVVEIYYNGSVVAKYCYDAWGNHKVLNPDNRENNQTDFIGNINKVRYRSYYYDEETQLFYCNSRYYSPELCRWISPDSIEYLDPQSINGLNLYCYCMNNPINKYDPSGHFAISAALFIGTIVVGALIGGGTAAYSSIKKGDEWYEVALKTLSGAALGGMLGAAMGTGAALAAGGTIAGLSVSASVAVGMGVTVGGSAVLGATNSFVNQIIDNDWDISKVSASRIGTDALVAGIKGLLSFGAGAWTGGAGLWNVPKGAAPGFLNAATKIYLNTVIGTGLKLSVDAIYAMLLGEECGWINGLKGVIDWVF